jgi:hypothetical protein
MADRRGRRRETATAEPNLVAGLVLAFCDLDDKASITRASNGDVTADLHENATAVPTMEGTRRAISCPCLCGRAEVERETGWNADKAKLAIDANR